jgi:IS605 OrfB family transposase
VTQEQRQQIFDLMKVCSEVFNLHTKYGFDNKTWSMNTHHKIYRDVRTQYPNLPSSVYQATRDQAREALHAVKAKRIPKKKQTSSIRYLTVTSSLRGNLLTLSSLEKRMKFLLHIPEVFNTYKSWTFQGGTLQYKKSEDRFYFNISYRTENNIQQLEQLRVLGIDRGLYNIATLSDGTIIKANEIRKQQRKHLYNRRKLQAKGTKSAKKRLKALSGKEMRFSKDFNHCITKKIATSDYDTFVLENLTNIKKQRKGRKLNKWIASWPFYQFEQFLEYKAEALGKSVVKVSPYFTSQTCSSCGIVNKQFRVKSKYTCECGNSMHADVNAAINIKQKYVNNLSTTIKSVEQGPVDSPDVSTQAKLGTS